MTACIACSARPWRSARIVAAIKNRDRFTAVALTMETICGLTDSALGPRYEGDDL